eukprot:1559972-Rhodomonas_salina.1
MQGSKPKAEGGKKRSRNSAGQGGTLNAKRMKSEAKPIKCLSAQEVTEALDRAAAGDDVPSAGVLRGLKNT